MSKLKGLYGVFASDIVLTKTNKLSLKLLLFKLWNVHVNAQGVFIEMLGFVHVLFFKKLVFKFIAMNRVSP